MSITWEITQLENGLRVVTTPVPTAQSASVNVFVGVGSRGEERRVNGISHYLEHLLFKGTAKRPTAALIAEAIEGAGGILNAYTSKELTCYWNHVPYDKLALAADVLADMAQRPTLDPEEIDRERSVVQQEIRRAHDQPSAWAAERLSVAVYGDQPIGWAIAGTSEIVQGIQREDFVRHMETWYAPGNMVLSVAGNVRHEEVVSLATDLFGGMTPREAPAYQPADLEPPADRIQVDQRDIAQSNMVIGLRTFGRTDPDRYALTILNNILGRGMSSRLFREVRERRGLAYAIGSSVSRYLDTGVLSISAGVSPEQVTATTRVVLDELKRLADEPVSEEELARARDHAIGSFRLGLETTMALGQRAGESLLTLGEIEPVETVVERLRAVSAEDVQRVAGRIIRGDNLAMSVVGPGHTVEELDAVLTL